MLWLLLIPILLYLLVMLPIAGKLAGINTYKPEKEHDTKVSVVIACRNEASRIPYLLSDIISQDHPEELIEVIIVDDWSSDNTAIVASAYGQIKNLKVIKNSGRGKKSAIRTGIEAAESELIITTDADCRFSMKWISTIVSFYAEKNPRLIICPVTVRGKKGFFHRFQELEFLSLQAITAGTAAAGNPVMCNGANLAFSRECRLRHKTQIRDEILSGDDIFFLQSIKREKNSQIAWLESADAVAETKPSDTIASFLNQRARWISKSPYYDDPYSKLLAIVTFVTILDLMVLAFAGFVNPLFFRYFLVAIVVKSLADFIILLEITRRRNRRDLLRWFIPSQLVYPFYVLAVAVYSLFRIKKW